MGHIDDAIELLTNLLDNADLKNYRDSFGNDIPKIIEIFEGAKVTEELKELKELKKLIRT